MGSPVKPGNTTMRGPIQKKAPLMLSALTAARGPRFHSRRKRRGVAALTSPTKPYAETFPSPVDSSCPYSPKCVEGFFCELRVDGVLGSWLRGSAGGIMLVVEGDIPLSLKRYSPVVETSSRKGVRMNHPQRIARVFGVLYLITFATSIPALFFFYAPVLEDPRYILGSGADNSVALGALLELILIIANIGTAVVLYPILKRVNE